MTDHLSRVSRSLLSIIGNTPLIPYPGHKHVYLKLEGFNPTGSIADRMLVDCAVVGATIHVTGPGEVCASAALLGAILGKPVTFQCLEASPFVRVARALGARPAEGQITTLELHPASALAALIAEIQGEAPEPATVIFPDSSPLHADRDAIDGTSVAWVNTPSDGTEEHLRLARLGILVDRRSAACLANRPVSLDGPLIIVAQSEGALEYAS